MKTPEDEAFEDIERKQGGGFQAKRSAAADKAQDESDMLTIAYLDGYERGKKAALAQPAQEPVARVNDDGFIVETGLTLAPGMLLYTAPPKREWVGLTPKDTEGFTSQEMTLAKYVSKVLQEKNT